MFNRGWDIAREIIRSELEAGGVSLGGPNDMYRLLDRLIEARTPVAIVDTPPARSGWLHAFAAVRGRIRDRYGPDPEQEEVRERNANEERGGDALQRLTVEYSTDLARAIVYATQHMPEPDLSIASMASRAVYGLGQTWRHLPTSQKRIVRRLLAAWLREEGFDESADALQFEW
jgi:hypothetical protein